MPWLECMSRSRGCSYWWHTETQASTFDRPVGLIVPASSVNIVAPTTKTVATKGQTQKVPSHASTDDRKRRAAGPPGATAGTGHLLGVTGTAAGPRPPEPRPPKRAKLPATGGESLFPVPVLLIPPMRGRALHMAPVGLLVASPGGSHLRADSLRSGLAERRRLGYETCRRVRRERITHPITHPKPPESPAPPDSGCLSDAGEQSDGERTASPVKAGEDALRFAVLRNIERSGARACCGICATVSFISEVRAPRVHSHAAAPAPGHAARPAVLVSCAGFDSFACRCAPKPQPTATRRFPRPARRSSGPSFSGTPPRSSGVSVRRVRRSGDDACGRGGPLGSPFFPFSKQIT